MFGINSLPLETPHSPCEERKIEVTLDSSEGVEEVVLRYMTWTDGLGWCSQKTIRIDGENLDDLHRALTVARHRLNRRRADNGQTQEPAKVIHLPTLT